MIKLKLILILEVLNMKKKYLLRVSETVEKMIDILTIRNKLTNINHKMKKGKKKNNKHRKKKKMGKKNI